MSVFVCLFYRRAGLHLIHPALPVAFWFFLTLALIQFFWNLSHAAAFMIAWLAITLFGTTISWPSGVLITV